MFFEKAKRLRPAWCISLYLLLCTTVTRPLHQHPASDKRGCTPLFLKAVPHSTGTMPDTNRNTPLSDSCKQPYPRVSLLARPAKISCKSCCPITLRVAKSLIQNPYDPHDPPQTDSGWAFVGPSIPWQTGQSGKWNPLLMQTVDEIWCKLFDNQTMVTGLIRLDLIKPFLAVQTFIVTAVGRSDHSQGASGGITSLSSSWSATLQKPTLATSGWACATYDNTIVLDLVCGCFQNG